MPGGNSGEPKVSDYEKAYQEDSAVKAAVDKEVARAQQAANQFVARGFGRLQITGDPRWTTPGEYPVTENWQKAIGAYQLWTSADVTVSGRIVTMTVTVHAADHYNFNPGQADIATGLPDNANGRFTELGWAQPFDTSGQVVRRVTWDIADPTNVTVVNLSE